MTAARRAALLATGLLAAACGKRGDPRPPIRHTPQPISGPALSQRGAAVELSYVAPRAMTDGSATGPLEIEIRHADKGGDFAKVMTRERRSVTPGERRLESWPLPAAGTILRISLVAVAAKRPSLASALLTLRVQAPPEPPGGLAAIASEKGIALAWSPPDQMPSPPPVPTPPPPAGASPSPAPPETAPSPSPAAAVAQLAPPLPAASPAPSPAPEASAQPTIAGSPTPAPSPTPTPVPTTGFHLYRRSADDAVYGRPLQEPPLQEPRFVDTTAAAGQEWCYVVRTVAATDPLIESEASSETCAALPASASPASPKPQ